MTTINHICPCCRQEMPIGSRSSQPTQKLPIIGRERALLNDYSKKLQTTALSQRGVRARHSKQWETDRGVAWNVMLEVGGKATGHMCRVEVTLDCLDLDLVE